MVGPRGVKLGSARGASWVVLDGLKAGEQVVVDGFQKIGRGAVKPVPWQPPAAAEAAPSAAPAAEAAASAAPAASSPR
jgi:membrane fusion protein (multidrug efflux system)